MRKAKLSRHRVRHNIEADCAECAAVCKCWDAPLAHGSGVIVQRQEELDRGTRLVTQGDRFNGVYIIVSGSLCLRETMPDGVERIVGFRLPGEVVGLEGWMHGSYPYSAEAAELTQTCRLGWPFATGTPDNSVLLERLLLKTMAQMDQSARLWPGLPAMERVAAFVEDFTRRVSALNGMPQRVKLPMTRAEIGSYLGLAEETVVRALAELRARNRLEVDGKSVSLVNGAAAAS